MALVDIQIILNDDFYIQQTVCLTDIICEKYEILFSNKIYNFNFSQSDYYKKTLFTIYTSTTFRNISCICSKISTMKWYNKHFYFNLLIYLIFRE